MVWLAKPGLEQLPQGRNAPARLPWATALTVHTAAPSALVRGPFLAHDTTVTHAVTIYTTGSFILFLIQPMIYDKNK
jgi:hypothetical protein